MEKTVLGLFAAICLLLFCLVVGSLYVWLGTRPIVHCDSFTTYDELIRYLEKHPENKTLDLNQKNGACEKQFGQHAR